MLYTRLYRGLAHRRRLPKCDHVQRTQTTLQIRQLDQELQQGTEYTLRPPPYVQEAIEQTEVLTLPCRIGIYVACEQVGQRA